MSPVEILSLRLIPATVFLAVAALLVQTLLWLVRPSSPHSRRIAWGCVLFSGTVVLRIPINIPDHRPNTTASEATAATVQTISYERPQTDAPVTDGTPAIARRVDMTLQGSTRPFSADEARVSPVPADVRGESQAPALAAPGLSRPHGRPTWWQAALAAWACGGLFLLGLGVLSYLRFACSARRFEPATGAWDREWQGLLTERKINRQIRMVVSRSFGPALCLVPAGYRLVVPRSLWTSLSDAERVAILRHELAHYERSDLLKSLLARLVVAVHWFNPAAWWARREFEVAGEWACDDRAACGCGRVEVARTLMQVAGIHFPSVPLCDAIGSGGLYARIRRLLTAAPLGDGPGKKLLIAGVSIAIASLALVRVNRVAVATSPAPAAAIGAGAAGAVAPASGKMLHFPQDRKVGMVIMRPPRGKGKEINPFEEGWGEIKPARGDVVVPQGYDVSLNLSPSAASDLGFLWAFAPDDIQTLSVNFAMPDVAQLRPIAKLRDLRGLNLGISVKHLTTLGVLPHLEHFSLIPQNGDRPESLVQAVEWSASLPELKSLNLSDCELPDAAIDVLPRCRKLESLIIEIPDLKDRHLRALASIPQLRSLDLRRKALKGELRGLNPTGLNKAAAVAGGFAHFEKSPHLETLRLWNFIVNAEMLRGLSRAKSLRSLGVENGKLADDAPAGLRELTQIRTLRLPDTDQPILARGVVAALATLPELREWPELGEIDEEMLDRITRAPHVESLNLHVDGKPISRASLARLGDLKELRRLKLSFFPLDDKGLASFARLKSLEDLDLWMTNVSGEGFRSLKDLPKLTYVSLGIREEVHPQLDALADLPHLTGLCLSGFDLRPGDYEPLGKLQNLRRLQILFGLADDTAVARFAGLTHLVDLVLNESMLTDRGLQSLSELKTLKRLEVGGVFTDNGIQRLSNLPYLRSLALNSDHVTNAGLEKLRKASRALLSARCEHPLRLRGELSIDAQGLWRRGDRETRKRLDPLEGHPAPALAVDNWSDSQGRKLTLNELKGKVVLIDFWGVWCGACVEALPNLQRIHDKFRDRGFELIGVHSTEHGERMSEFAREHKLDWPLAVDIANKTESAYRVKGWPALYLIDRQGILRVAEPHPLQLEVQIERLLAEPVVLAR
jgi:beta-lactamase regulating signal transducer with metallopeptidase domain/thiol-disulfide isomerase/thioredoxin